VYYKGCETLMEAFSRVVGARLRIVGAGPLMGSLKKRALPFAEKVDFLGEITDDELLKEYAGCDMLVLPSVARSEAFGLVQIEAMRFGKPVINTNLKSGVPYVSLDGVTGLTVAPGDVGALAGAMQRLIDDDALREKFGRAARKRVNEEFLETVMLSRIEDLYNNIIKPE
jgi:rhamnosyl/mannosyltransferase